jgi:hypothetical protein
MNRETFVTLYKTRLFPADQVVDIVEREQEKLLCELLAYIHPDSNAGCVIKEKLAELRQKEDQKR